MGTGCCSLYHSGEITFETKKSLKRKRGIAGGQVIDKYRVKIERVSYPYNHGRYTKQTNLYESEWMPGLPFDNANNFPMPIPIFKGIKNDNIQEDKYNKTFYVFKCLEGSSRIVGNGKF